MGGYSSGCVDMEPLISGIGFLYSYMDFIKVAGVRNTAPGYVSLQSSEFV